jgi:protein-disulfide isomerase
MRRRAFLAASAAAATTLAGCQSDTLGGGGDSSGDSLSDHAAGTAIDSQPRLGPEPADVQGVIVAFEDPSCPRCRAFEQQVVPKIKSNLTDPGDAAYVFRGYPVVYDWGEPAAHALEATYARDEAAAWDLIAHYFDQQDAFRSAGTDRVYPRTRTFLAEETELDADAVISAAKDDGSEAVAAVQTDLDAGEDAGAGQTTPHVFLFRDGEFLTKVSGSTSYDAISGALQL